MDALAREARLLSSAAYDSVEKIAAERMEAGAPLTNQEAFDLTVQLTKYRHSQDTKRGAQDREMLRTMMQRMRRAPDPETTEASNGD